MRVIRWAQRELGEEVYDLLRRAANPEGLAIADWQRNYDAGFYGPTPAALRAELAELHARVEAIRLPAGERSIEEDPTWLPADISRLRDAIDALTQVQAWQVLTNLFPQVGATSDAYSVDAPYLKDMLYDHLAIGACLQSTDEALADLYAHLS
ncbi:MAG: hypothetical protein HGA45_27605 [Chloroflexales bacterium]|nr:hypothetical protein [Chloroflexales bacterium]